MWLQLFVKSINATKCFSVVIDADLHSRPRPTSIAKATFL